jgi:hypothetical protein
MSAEPTQYHGGYVGGDDIFVTLNELVNAMSNAFAEPEDFERFGACLVLMKDKSPEEAGMLMVVLQNAHERAQGLMASITGGVTPT